MPRSRLASIALCLVFALMPALLATCAHAPGPSYPRSSTAQAAAAVAVQSECRSPFGSDGGVLSETLWGSGVVIDERHVLTALHVVWCPAVPRIRVYFADGRSRAMVPLREDRVADLAMLDAASLEPLPGGPPPTFGARPDVGATVCAATAIPARAWSCGSVVSHERPADSDVRHTAPTLPGNSGSGVYDGAGRLVGIVTALRTDGSGGYFVSLASRDGFLRR